MRLRNKQLDQNDTPEYSKEELQQDQTLLQQEIIDKYPEIAEKLHAIGRLIDALPTTSASYAPHLHHHEENTIEQNLIDIAQEIQTID